MSRWVRGQRPRGRTASLIAEVLGEKLGRTVSLEEIGMADERSLATGAGLHFAPRISDAVDQVCELWRSDAGHRGFLFGSTVSASALIGPSRDWLIADPDPALSRSGGPRAGCSDVDGVRATTQALAELDHRFGSGHVRPIVVHYLNSVVSGLLRASYSESVGRQLFAAVARATELAGYMAADTGRAGLAQRYYIQALRLSLAAGDRGFGGYVLAAGMSRLAPSLGYPREIAQLARTAREGARGQATPAAEALFHAVEARGHALLGDERACHAAAETAEKALEQTNQTGEPEWSACFDQAYLADELAHCYRDLDQPVLSAWWAERALGSHPQTRVRRRAIDLLLLATARVQLHDVEQACETAGLAVDLLCGVRSYLGTQYLNDFRRKLQTFDEETTVREFNARVEGSEVGAALPW